LFSEKKGKFSTLLKIDIISVENFQGPVVCMTTQRGEKKRGRPFNQARQA
jgi:hypothetical protein